uniref:Uncharacterized protein n=1 Tax=Cacopsylla melanoneura TaxID=428564 RepID=A0A8D8LR97_9HEMI
MVSEKNRRLRQAAMGDNRGAAHTQRIHACAQEDCQVEDRTHRCRSCQRFSIHQNQTQARHTHRTPSGGVSSPLASLLHRVVVETDLFQVFHPVARPLCSSDSQHLSLLCTHRLVR